MTTSPDAMSAHLAPYADYRDSGLPWLGTIPAYWDEKRAKHLFREIDERSATGEEELLSVSHVTGVTPRSEKTITMFKAESYQGHKLCRPGDLVVNTMWAWMAALGVSRHVGIVSPSYAVYRPIGTDGLVPEYADMLLRTWAYKAEYHARSTGIRSSRLRLYPERFLDIPILRPPLDEQHAIVRFLNAKDAEFGRLIRAKRRLIELLNEEKQAIVQRAVTRGLDPDVRLKPSGVEWLGEVPEHWAVPALRLRYQVDLGKMLDAKRITGLHLVPYLRNVDVQWDKVNADELPMMDIQTHEYVRYTLEAGDMLVCEGGDVGRTAFWRGELPVCGFQKALHRLRPIDRSRDNPRFLYYVLLMTAKRGVFVAEGNENTIVHLTNEKLRAYRFPFPPKTEQDAIARYLDHATAEIDSAIKRIRREMVLIQEYRTRLTADVLTGRMDVRHLANLDGFENEAIHDGMDIDLNDGLIDDTFNETVELADADE